MKRVANFLVAPLRLIARCVALLAAALLLIGDRGLTAFLQTAQLARDTLLASNGTITIVPPRTMATVRF